MRATVQNVFAEQGAVLALVFRGPASEDLTGRDLVLTVKKTPISTTSKLVGSTDNGMLTVVNAQVVRLDITSDVMEALSVTKASEDWVYSIESSTSAEDVVREWEGKFTISKDLSSTGDVPDVDANGYLLYTSPQSLTTGQQDQALVNLGLSTQRYADREEDWTLALSDRNKDQWYNNGASALVCTIPPNSGVAFTVGDCVPFLRLSSGVATITADVAVTLNGVVGGSCTINTQFQGALVKKVGADSWVVSGDVSAVAAVEGWLWPDESGPVLWGDETEVLTEEV